MSKKTFWEVAVTVVVLGGFASIYTPWAALITVLISFGWSVLFMATQK